MTEERRYPSFTTPRGVFKLPSLSNPITATRSSPKPDGEYSVTVVYSADDPAARAFIAKLKPYHDAAVETAEREFKKLDVAQRKRLKEVTVNDLFKTVYDNETEEPTGEIEFKFSMPASGVVKQGPRKGKKWSASRTSSTPRAARCSRSRPFGAAPRAGLPSRPATTSSSARASRASGCASPPFSLSRWRTRVHAPRPATASREEDGYAHDERTFGEAQDGPIASSSRAGGP